MIYGKPNNPYQFNATNRSRQTHSNAPINKLAGPVRFQSGGLVPGLKQMIGDRGKDIEERWSSLIAGIKGKGAFRKTRQTAQREMNRLRNRAKKNPLLTLISIIQPQIGLLMSVIDAYSRTKQLKSGAEAAEKSFRGSSAEESFGDVADHAGRGLLANPIKELMKGLFNLKMSDALGTLGDGTEAVGDAAELSETVTNLSDRILSGDEAVNVTDVMSNIAEAQDVTSGSFNITGDDILEFGKETAIATQAGNPGAFLFSEISKRFPEFQKTLSESPALRNLIVQSFSELDRGPTPKIRIPDDPRSKYSFQRYI